MIIPDYKPFILAADDEPNNLQLLGNILSADDYNFTLVTNGRQVFQIVEKRLPDLILLDIMMPEIDGFEVCRTLKANPRTSDIPIIFLTAKTDTDDIARGFDLGASDYVIKPFNQKELLARIRTHLENIKISNERKELLHIVCHDLVNSISPVISALNMMENYELFAEMKEIALSAANNGLNLIKMVRQFCALEDKKFMVQIVPVELKGALNEALVLLNMKFSDKQIQVCNEAEHSLFVFAETVSLINSVIINIFTNAVKFSDPGSRIIIKTEQEKDTVILSIKDFGIGMPLELQKNIFDMKKTTIRSGTNGEFGTGFGMPLVKRFMMAYGGNIELISSDNPNDHGTEIRLIFKQAASCITGSAYLESNPLGVEFFEHLYEVMIVALWFGGHITGEIDRIVHQKDIDLFTAFMECFR